jgi:CelD/BcsL family acetyltransferase involved in cellulose biosynthesis
LHDFFRRYCATASRKGILRLFFYAVGGQPVAMHLGVEYARKLWIYKLGHDEAWSRISPGMHLANETIRYAFEHKLDGYEFLGSGEAWQHAWPVATHDYCSILIYPFSWQGVRGIWDSAITLLRNRVNTAKQSDRSR